MQIVIAGGSGFLGSPLAETYAEDSHDVRVLTRGLAPGESRHESGTGVPGITRVGWKPDGQSGPWAAAIDGADAVINLAGASIGEKRWTPQRKAELRDSRILATRSLAAAIKEAAAPPRVFISSSAIGYYGTSTDGDTKTETSPPGADFFAHLCEDWEAEAGKAARDGMRLVTIRSGLVFERSGGALAKMMTPFRFFAGGPLGSGRQYMSWIHRLDWIEMVRWIVQTPEASRPVQPHRAAPRDQPRVRARARPLAATPRAAAGARLRAALALGEFANYVVTGQRVVPAHAQKLGYHFRYPELDIAFRGIFGD